MIMLYLFLDTETTGKHPATKKKYRGARLAIPAFRKVDEWPRAVQVAWLLFRGETLVEEVSHLVRPDGFTIPSDATAVHGITTDRALKEGVPIGQVLDELESTCDRADLLIAHNVEFDMNVMAAEYYRNGWTGREDWDQTYPPVKKLGACCTMRETTQFCALPSQWRSGYKWPKLDELHQKLFGTPVEDAHDALADVKACARCFFEMKSPGIESHV
jgi:DNA polymerase III epsilon subunit-like protein